MICFEYKTNNINFRWYNSVICVMVGEFYKKMLDVDWYVNKFIAYIFIINRIIELVNK